jgi:hypothetical protein
MDSISSISEIQEEIKEILEANSYFANHNVPILIENAKDIEFQIKSAMSALGIAATVATPTLSYRGQHAGQTQQTPFWSMDSANIVIVESPTLNRGKESYATALDAALQVALTIQKVPNICNTTISQTTRGGLVVVTVNFKTNVGFSLVEGSE